MLSQTLSSALKFLNLARKHRIPIDTSNRRIGIRDTLIGWALIGLSTVLFNEPIKIIPIELDFSVQFLSAVIFLFLLTIIWGIFKGKGFKGYQFLKICKGNEISARHAQLSPNRRIGLIYTRGLIATGGYVTYELAKVSIGLIDNSTVHGADALMYALLAFFLLGQRYTLGEWVGILISIFGVLIVLHFDISSIGGHPILGYLFGLGSSLSLAVILILTSVIVQHDHPLRVAFHQCLCGLLISLIFLFFYGNKIDLHYLSNFNYKSSIGGGVCYATALIFFFRGFLFVEPIVISVLGYSLTIFVMLFNSLIFTSIEFLNFPNIISSLIITLGSSILVVQEYRKDKKENLMDKAVHESRQIYQRKQEQRLIDLKTKYQNGELTKYKYISHMYEYHSLFHEWSDLIQNTQITMISIEKEAVIFSFQSRNLQIEIDKSCRSAPLEILNFEDYDKEDEYMLSKIFHNEDIIFDIGANIGWYSLNLARLFPQAKIYSFEPIPETYILLEKNIKRNNTKNIKTYNFGFSNKIGTFEFYYTQFGSPIASEKNIFDLKNYNMVNVHLKKIDNFIDEVNFSKIDCIKCDAEGAELEILQGAKNTVEKFLPVLLLEIVENWCKKFDYEGNDIIKYLKNMNYSCYLAHNEKLRKINHIDLNNVEKYNYFFLHNEKHKKIIEEFKER